MRIRNIVLMGVAIAALVGCAANQPVETPEPETSPVPVEQQEAPNTQCNCERIKPRWETEQHFTSPKPVISLRTVPKILRRSRIKWAVVGAGAAMAILRILPIGGLKFSVK